MQGRLDLLGKARLLTALRREETYAWISPDELLILRPTVVVSGLYQPGQKMHIPSAAYRLQISTGAETPLSEFNRQHSESLVAYVGTPAGDRPKWMSQSAPRAILSPNGRFLLWTVRTGWRVASLDGKETIDRRTDTESNCDTTRETGCGSVVPLWLADSRSWLGIGGYGILKRRRILQWGMDQSERGRTTFVLGWRDGFVCGVTADNRLLLQCPPRDYSGITVDYLNTGKLPTETTFLAVELGGGVRTARRFRLPLPTPGIIGRNFHRQIVISPDGRRLAWTIRGTLPPWSPQTMAALGLPPTEDIHSLWISDISGNDFQEIGWTSEPRKAPETDAPLSPKDLDNIMPTFSRLPWPDDLQWSPDGRQISFTYRDNLFAVSVS